MQAQTIPVRLEEDHIRRIVQCSPEEALTELTWNAVDAGATEVRIVIRRNPLGGIESVEVTDNGCGIAQDEVDAAFGSLGHSVKPERLVNERGKAMHGKLGEGRFKAYKLGDRVEWLTSAAGSPPMRITGEFATIGRFVKIPLEESALATRGTQFVACNGRGADLQLPGDEALANRLGLRFAPKLLADPDVRIFVGECRVEPSRNIDADLQESLPPPHDGSRIRTVVWKRGDAHEFHWCDANFISRRSETIDLNVPLSYSVFLASPLIDSAVQQNTLATAELAGLGDLKAAAIDQSRLTLEKIAKKTVRKTIEELKARQVYPYEGEPRSPVEKLERQVFDVCTTTILRSLPAIETVNRDSQRLTFHLLKQAVESSPSTLGEILQQVLKLPTGEVKQLSELLRQVTLSSLIRLGTLVTDRLRCISGLEALVLDPEWAKSVKERRHLHKIMEQETWLFGEQFSLGTSDERLDKVLQYHLHLLGHGEDTLSAPDDPDEFVRIPDLVLGRQFITGSGDRYEHLVVELKRPTVKLGNTEMQQIIEYASTIASAGQFDKSKTRWFFHCISTHVHERLTPSLEQRDRPRGLVHASTNLEVWISTWAEILQAAKGRMEYLKGKLDFQSSSDAGLAYLRSTYPDIMSEIEDTGG